MTTPTKLGGFKILKEVVWTSIVATPETPGFAASFCRLLAEGGINLAYLTLGRGFSRGTMNVVVDAQNGDAVAQRTAHFLGGEGPDFRRAVILSLFPHRSNPHVMGALLGALGRQEVRPMALASSSSAVSMVLGEEAAERAAASLFGPFNFSAYRTPSDWKLAQKGKEALYKEVVASYQEKRPKVYALEWQDEQQLLAVTSESSDLGRLGAVFQDFARMDLSLNFLVASLSEGGEKVRLLFSLPGLKGQNYPGIIESRLPHGASSDMYPVGVFSMNGPHFGDRYGIARDLLTAFDQDRVELLGLCCSIHSITGAVPANMMQPAIRAIQGCFEVPSVIKKTPFISR